MVEQEGRVPFQLHSLLVLLLLLLLSLSTLTSASIVVHSPIAVTCRTAQVSLWDFALQVVNTTDIASSIIAEAPMISWEATRHPFPFSSLFPSLSLLIPSSCLHIYEDRLPRFHPIPILLFSISSSPVLLSPFLLLFSSLLSHSLSLRFQCQLDR